MAKQQKEELPLMDDFTEDSLFDQLEEEDDSSKGADDDDENDDDDESTDDESTDEDEESNDDDDESSSDDDESDDEEDDDSKSKSKPKAKSKGKEDKDDEESDDEEESTETFWTDVEKLTGRTIEAEYGDTDPESPEGAAIREEALVQGAINDHLDYLQKVYPREFRALEHAANGGKMEDLYNPAEPDYSKMVIPKDDEEFQKNFMRNYYQKKGLSVAKANRMVEGDEDSDEGLLEATKEALKEMSAGQEKSRSKVAKDQEVSNKKNRQQDAQMIGAVEQVIQTGKLNKFTVPVKEREEFHQFALSHMQRNPNGGYMFVQPVNGRQLEQQLQEMYFTYKRGDLSSIIQREVRTEGAKKLKRVSSKSTTKKGAGGDGGRGKKRGSLPTMEEYNA